MPAAHVSISFTSRGFIAEVTPSINHLLWRTSAYSQLQSATGNQISCTRVFHHVEWIFITHINHRSTNLNLVCLGTDGRQQREWRRQLCSKMMHPEVCTV